MLEIEMKASLKDLKPEAVAETAEKIGFAPHYDCREEDVYYNGINRDFRKTDEALRVRVHTQDGHSETCLTYKGPKQDPRSQTRTELETRAEDPATLKAILEQLGFQPVLTVCKNRRGYRRDGLHLCLDVVDGLGCFLELEIVAPDSTGDGQKNSLLDELYGVLDALGVPRENLTRKSYLELLMERAMSKKSVQGV